VVVVLLGVAAVSDRGYLSTAITSSCHHPAISGGGDGEVLTREVVLGAILSFPFTTPSASSTMGRKEDWTMVAVVVVAVGCDRGEEKQGDGEGVAAGAVNSWSNWCSTGPLAALPVPAAIGGGGGGE